MTFFRERKIALNDHYMSLAIENEHMRSESSLLSSPVVPSKTSNKVLAKQGMFPYQGHIFMFQIHHDGDEFSENICWSFFVKQRKSEVIW
jgi:regulator of replication initiation timing